MKSQANRPSSDLSQTSTLVGLRLLVALALAVAVGPVRAITNEEHPPQREWVHKEYADVVSGDLYPAALLMSRNILTVPAKATSSSQGYLSVGNYRKRPMEVTLFWDEPRRELKRCSANLKGVS